MDPSEKPGILLETKNSELIVRFCRPELRNPLSISQLARLDRIVDDVKGNTDISKVIFTGSGDVFASGADLREIAGVDAENAAEFALRGQRLMNKIAALPQETLAFVNGYCFGGALDLALSCSRRVATAGALFCHPGANLGIMTGWGGTQRLPRLVGEAKALEMFITAKVVTAIEARTIGLIDEIVDAPM